MIIINKEFKILGSDWKLKSASKKECPLLENNDGYVDYSVRLIVVSDFAEKENDARARENLAHYQNQVIRHEIIHAFLCESGFDGQGHYACNWDLNEEMIDWFAIQGPKIMSVWKELGV